MDGSTGVPHDDLTPADWALLDLVGRHPFLPSDRLQVALDWSATVTRRRRNSLLQRGLLRLVSSDEVGPVRATLEPVELTGAALNRLAARQGLPLAAVRWNELAGGGPDRPVGNRRQLLAVLDHTLGADEVFLGLYRAARRVGNDARLVEWRNAAACARGRVRPDGYGLYRQRGHLYGFFLEFDRGTMRRRDYGRKFAAYYHYRDRGLYARDYEGYPTLLVVTTAAAEDRIAAAVRVAAVGREPLLPVLLTTRERLERAAEGLLGPIWHKATSTTRRYWLQG